MPPIKPDISAKKAFGHFAACGRARAEDGDHSKAAEYLMLELLEYGGAAEHAMELIREIQSHAKYTELVACAQAVEQRSFALALLEQGLEEAEAEQEASADIAQNYAMIKMGALIEEAVAVRSDEYLDSLRKISESLGASTAVIISYLRIASTPVALGNALEKLREALAVVLEQLEGSEDAEFETQAAEARAAVESCPDRMVERDVGCDARLMADAAQQQANAASAAAGEAAAIKVKSLKDAKRMEKAFVKANTMAKEACVAMIKCAAFISEQSAAQSNEPALEKAIASIQEAFSAGVQGVPVPQPVVAEAPGARPAALKAAAPKAAPKVAAPKDAPKVAAPKAVPKEAAPEPVGQPAAAEPAPNEQEQEQAKQELLNVLEEFSKKRWDTSLAAQSLKRLVDRRKEVIGQLWLAVETEADNAPRLAEKFTEQFRNKMDAARRLEAVVRLIGRGQRLDPRTSRWFVDSIMSISAQADKYFKAHS